MSGNHIGFDLQSSYFFVHTSNSAEVARFGNADDYARFRLYTHGKSNLGYEIDVIQTSVSNVQDLSLRSTNADVASPSIYIDGASGNVGIGTDHPRYRMEVKGDMFIEGQLFQEGSNYMFVTEVIQSSILGVSTVFSCNVEGTIDFSGATLSNIGDVHVNHTVYASNLEVYGNIAVAGAPLLQVHGDMQRIQTSGSQIVIETPGTHQMGYVISWDSGGSFVDMNMIEVAGMFIGSGENTRLYHRFESIVTPDTLNDTLTDEKRMTSDNITHGPKLFAEYLSASSFRIFIQWDSYDVSYSMNSKLDVYAPLVLGEVQCVPFVYDNAGPPSITVIGDMQRLQYTNGHITISSAGSHRIGYIIAWSEAGPFSNLNMIEITCKFSGIGGTTRLMHKFHCLIDPTDNAGAGLPGLDVITEQSQVYIGDVSIPVLVVERVSSQSIRLFTTWSSTTNASYRIHLDMDVFAPNLLGTIASTAFYE